MSAPLILILLAASVFYFIWYSSHINGLRDLAHAAIAAKTLPGWNQPLMTEYVGIGPIDRLLTTLTTFFYPVADATSPGLFLHSIAFSGAFGAAWMMISLESWRGGSAWTAAAFPSILGIAAQTLTFAFATPTYGYLHLTRSLAARTPTVKNMRVPHGVIKALPIVYTVAMQAPSIAMVLPLTKYMTHDRKQLAIAIWQPWPLYVSALLVLAHYTVGVAFSDANTPSNGRKIKSSLRYVYGFAFVATAVPHIIVLALSGATVVAPRVFQTQYVDSWNPVKLFGLPLPWDMPAHKVASVAEGVQIFLKWDFAIGSVSFLVWALSLHRAAHRAAKVQIDQLALLHRVVGLTLVSGLIGAGIELLWEREELFLPDTEKPTQPVAKKRIQ